jgi:hypothetical protein
MAKLLYLNCVSWVRGVIKKCDSKDGRSHYLYTKQLFLMLISIFAVLSLLASTLLGSPLSLRSSMFGSLIQLPTSSHCAWYSLGLILATTPGCSHSVSQRHMSELGNEAL